ncbi:MAG: branched-chain amino acid ABC transporter permease [Thermoleophilia bacterium]|nr:branched-chain amino acid ABC transporter permease [Thermoleophilia bacterium]
MKTKRTPRLVGAIGLFVALVLFGVFYRNDYVLHVFILIMMNAVLASSLRLTSLSGQLSLAHGGFVTVGAYTSALLLLKAGLSSTWVALVLSGVVAGVVAAAVGVPFSRLKGVYFTMVGIFFVQVIILAVEQWRTVTGGPLGIQGVPRPDSILLIRFGSKTSFYFLALSLMVISLLILWAIEHSRVGLTFRGIKQADSLAASLGVNVTAYKVAAFAIGAFFAGLMGGFYVQYVSAVDPSVFGFLPTIYMLIYVIVGGQGSFVGPIVGATLLTVLPEVARPLKSWMPLLFAAILMAIIFLMPEGLIGLPRRLLSLTRKKTREQVDATG